MSQQTRNRNKTVRQQARRQRALDRLTLKKRQPGMTDAEWAKYVERREVERLH